MLGHVFSRDASLLFSGLENPFAVFSKSMLLMLAYSYYFFFSPTSLFFARLFSSFRHIAPPPRRIGLKTVKLIVAVVSDGPGIYEMMTVCLVCSFDIPAGLKNFTHGLPIQCLRFISNPFLRDRKPSGKDLLFLIDSRQFILFCL